mgnify:FL=1
MKAYKASKNPFVYIYAVWSIVFVLLPLVILLGNSVLVTTGGESHFSMANFARVLDPLYLKVIWRSLKLALLTTLICLILGYPMAMILAKSGFGKGSIMVILLIIPMWMNFLARTYAWMSLLDGAGILSTFLKSLGLPGLNVLYTEGAVILGMVYNFLPFMILPIYSVLIKIDHSLIEAAEDLGAAPMKVFSKITLPLSVSGVITGITMVFLPAVSTFVISRLLGGGKVNMVGNLIETQFLTSSDWGFGSALSVVVMVLILISMFIMNRFGDGEEGVVMM